MKKKLNYRDQCCVPLGEATAYNVNSPCGFQFKSQLPQSDPPLCQYIWDAEEGD